MYTSTYTTYNTYMLLLHIYNVYIYIFKPALFLAISVQHIHASACTSPDCDANIPFARRHSQMHKDNMPTKKTFTHTHTR